MPSDDKHIRLEYCATDYAIIKLAAALKGAANLKSFAAQVLLAHSTEIVKQFRSHKQGDDVCNPSF